MVWGVLWLGLLASAFVRASRHPRAGVSMLGATLGGAGLISTVAANAGPFDLELGIIFLPAGAWAGYGLSKCLGGDRYDRTWARRAALLACAVVLIPLGQLALADPSSLAGAAWLVAGLGAHWGLPVARLLRLDRRLVVYF